MTIHEFYRLLGKPAKVNPKKVSLIRGIKKQSTYPQNFGNQSYQKDEMKIPLS